MIMRPACDQDCDAIWAIFEPILRTGDTYALPRDMNRHDALAFWFAPGHEVFVAVDDANVVGACFLRANQKGGGSHVANCGYIVSPACTGRGAARAMCAHSIEHARLRGFRAMQFNFVVSTNHRAVRLWEHLGFHTAGRLPDAFLHPQLGFVDALVMYREI